MSLLDSNESSSAFKFEQTGRDFKRAWWAPVLTLDGVEEKYDEGRLGTLAPSAAKFFTFRGSFDPVPDGQEAYLKVTSTGADVIVSVTSHDADFIGDPDTPIVTGNSHLAFNTADQSEMVFDEFDIDLNVIIPDLLISVINPDTTSNANVKVGFGIRNLPVRTIVWRSPLVCDEVNEQNFSRKWSISLLLNNSDVTGSIYFHSCPGGGRVIYNLSGNVAGSYNTYNLTGTKSGGQGELYFTSPATTQFSLVYNASPAPNYAP